MAPIYAQVVLLRALPEIQVVLESTAFCTKKYVHLFLVLKVRRRVVSDGNHLVFFPFKMEILLARRRSPESASSKRVDR